MTTIVRAGTTQWIEDDADILILLSLFAHTYREHSQGFMGTLDSSTNNQHGLRASTTAPPLRKRRLPGMEYLPRRGSGQRRQQEQRWWGDEGVGWGGVAQAAGH